MSNRVIYFQSMIFLTRASKLKEKLLEVAYEGFLSKPSGFIREYHTILKGFIWKGFKEEMHHHMRKCMAFLKDEERHKSLEELSQPLPFSLGVRGGPSMSHLTSLNQVHGKDCIYVHHVSFTMYFYFLTIHVQGIAPRGGTL